MCGIFCTVWNGGEDENIPDYASSKCMIERRGPDYLGERLEKLSEQWRGFFVGSILWMQGPRLFQQPCSDPDGNILLWNGDIFSGELAQDDVSDTETLKNVLGASRNVPETLRKVKGPYSVVYYKKSEKTLYFARDRLGRHSLLVKTSPNCDCLTVSSLANGNVDDFVQVPAIGVFSFRIDDSALTLCPWARLDARSANCIETMEARLGMKIMQVDPFAGKNEKSPSLEPEPGDIDFLDRISFGDVDFEDLDKIQKIVNPLGREMFSEVMKTLSERPTISRRIESVLKLLKNSIRLRIEKKRNFCKNCIQSGIHNDSVICEHSKIGVLFSGGLDSTLLAALADQFVAKDESIDLVNVAFEKCRKIDAKPSANESSPNFDVPDRKTGRMALAELRKICPWRRWNFVECNVTQEELERLRSSRIRSLVHPGSTILDESLGCALWFASRGSGVLASTGQRYESPCRVLLLGMGADELFGGYTRHRTILRRNGWPGLGQELALELARISERNLGRDDRVVADHGRQSRLPYLDEEFVDYVSSLHPWQRCYPKETMPAGLGDKLLLRLVAHGIGLHETASFPKRAFQFGSRIANPKENASDISTRLR